MSLAFDLFCISGDLLVTLSRRSDSGHYSCEVINEEGIDIAHTKVLVKGNILTLYQTTNSDLDMIQSICRGPLFLK